MSVIVCRSVIIQLGNKEVCSKKGRQRKISTDMSKATVKSKRGESGSQYRQCVTPCPRFITSGDTHSLCVVCLGAKHAESAFEEAGCPHCEQLPIHTLGSRRTLFEEGVFAPLRRSGGCTRGARNWIWQRDLRRLNPYLCPHLPDPLPVLWVRKPVLRFLPLRGRGQCFTYLPPRRKMWRALVFRPLYPHNMRSY